MKNPRFEDSAVAPLRFPDKDKIKCGRCIYRAKDRKVGKETIYGATLGMCMPYPIKPPSIMLKDAECPYFCDENEY